MQRACSRCACCSTMCAWPSEWSAQRSTGVSDSLASLRSGVEGIEEDSHKGEAGSMADEATVSALQAELEGFLDVHAQFTHPHLAPLGFDAAKAAAGDTQALVVLAACTLVAALRSDGRQEFVQIIMDLPEAQQQALMTATKTLMERMAQPSGEEAEAEWDGEEEAVHLRAQVRQLKLELVRAPSAPHSSR